MCFNFNFSYLTFLSVNAARIITILTDCAKVSRYILYIDLRLLSSIVFFIWNNFHGNFAQSALLAQSIVTILKMLSVIYKLKSTDLYETLVPSFSHCLICDTCMNR